MGIFLWYYGTLKVQVVSSYSIFSFIIRGHLILVIYFITLSHYNKKYDKLFLIIHALTSLPITFLFDSECKTFMLETMGF